MLRSAGVDVFCIFRCAAQAAGDVQRCLCVHYPLRPWKPIQSCVEIFCMPTYFRASFLPLTLGFVPVLPSYPLPRRWSPHASRRVSTTVNNSRRGCSSTTSRSSSGGARRGVSPLAISISTRRRRAKTSAWRTRCRGCDKGPTLVVVLLTPEAHVL